MRTTVFTLFFVLSSLVFATGPSYIYERMNPISINDKGEILCRTKYQTNHMGAGYPMDIEYGLCVLSGDSIIKKHVFTLQYKSYPPLDYQKHLEYWEKLYNSPYDESKYGQGEIESDLCREYGFKKGNVASYQVNDTLTVKDLQLKKGIYLSKIPLRALNGGKSQVTLEDTSVELVLTHNFGHILFFNNNITKENALEEYPFVEFDYSNPFLPFFYEIQYITGVLFLKKPRK